MRPPKHQRTNPKHLAVSPPPAGVDLAAVAQNATYIGSAYHKDLPSFAGPAARPRPDASICPRHLATNRDTLLAWLREAIASGHVGGLWENGFPRYVWRREGDTVYEARLIDNHAGSYKGYPLAPDEQVRGLP